MALNMMPIGKGRGSDGDGGDAMTSGGCGPIRCQSCGKLVCEADGMVVFRWPEAHAAECLV